MIKPWTFLQQSCKVFFCAFALFVLAACSTNPATGDRQFTALLPASQEADIGASEHEKIKTQFGLYEEAALTAYVNEVGRRVTQNTERPDVRYRFFILDSPIINAFALPGGYIYVSRGLLALANNEAEMAAVLAHEAGHVTARHSAERYSHSVLTSLGTAVLSAAVDNSTLSQALGVGSHLYLSSYSRGQENEADMLGLRYLTQAGYNAQAMPKFLNAMQAHATLESRLQGSGGETFNFFSTHPATGDRIQNTAQRARSYTGQGTLSRESYFRAIDGMIYGDSSKQGYIRGQRFLHPEIGLAFEVPGGFTLTNQPNQVVAKSDTGAVMIFDMAAGRAGLDPADYLAQQWMRGENLQGLERINVNGMEGATAAFSGQVAGRPATIRLMAVRWNQNTMARFQIAVPRGASAALVDNLKRASYSLRRLSEQERAALKPYRLQVITAQKGDTAASLAARMPFDRLNQERFRVLNGLTNGQPLQPGQMYKIVVE